VSLDHKVTKGAIANLRAEQTNAFVDQWVYCVIQNATTACNAKINNNNTINIRFKLIILYKKNNNCIL
jgi:hypothetical protein